MEKDYSQFHQWLSETRRDFHMHPEISHQETRTTAKIVEVLKEFNCEVQLFDDMTGAVGIIRGAQDGPTIGLRADIDALPIQELNDIPYKSQNPGAMHACGHDAHATIMLGVARNIMGSEDFSYFTLERPSAIMRLGCSNSRKGLARSLHSPYFDIDEQVLEVGVAIFSEAVARFLAD